MFVLSTIIVLSVIYSTNANNSQSDPLVLTDYLSNPELARSKAKIHSIGYDISEQSSGFFRVNDEHDSNTFFWFSRAIKETTDTPILLWLQGGPGASSMFGMFTEIGAFNIGDEKGTIVERKVSWNQDYHLLFLDNPVGTGFSFTGSEDGYATNQTQVGHELVSALSQFFTVYPSLRSNDFYVTGESYAGKWVPTCAYAIHEYNKNAKNKINLKGISIGDGAMDPPSQLGAGKFGDLLFNLGMIDTNEKQVFDKYRERMIEEMNNDNHVGAFHIFDEMLNGDIFPYGSYYANVTGMKTNYFNFEQSPDGSSLTQNYFIDWLSKNETARNAIHVGAVPYNVLNSTVEKYLLGDWFLGVKEKVVTLLENDYKVLIYSGQNDIILGPALTEPFLQGLKWSGQADFQKATKSMWYTDDGKDLAGWIRQVDKTFTYAVVRNAGHMVPGDQPERALDLLSRFVGDQW